MKALKVAVVGGGASGFFAAIRAAEVAKREKVPCEVSIFEATPNVLKKVKISGGGRCNVTHNQFDSRLLTQNYPRGQKELLSPFQRFQPKDTLNWFLERGVKIKAEDDGRMFPITDSSQTIIDCFLKEIKRLGVSLHKNQPVQKIKLKDGGKYEVHFKSAEPENFDRILIATGSGKKGYELAESLGHSITELAPSLFTFKINHPLLKGLEGTSFEKANLRLVIADSKPFTQLGPLLITHWGLSGPALLKLSAWAAREMKRSNYQAKLLVSWLGEVKQDQVKEELQTSFQKNQNAHIQNVNLKVLTKRFWKQFLEVNDVPLDKRCSEVSKKELNRLVQGLVATELPVTGNSRFKEEFVECGGVNLKEIDFKTMQSKKSPGLFFTGEVLDIDGITGGFNFQHAWTSAWIAGEAMITKRYADTFCDH